MRDWTAVMFANVYHHFGVCIGRLPCNLRSAQSDASWHRLKRAPQSPIDLAVCVCGQHECFWVNHYAARVLYTVEDWVERNMDSVPQSFSDTMHSSSHQVWFGGMV